MSCLILVPPAKFDLLPAAAAVPKAATRRSLRSKTLTNKTTGLHYALMPIPVVKRYEMHSVMK
jgi:hypothetical protein